MTIFDASKPVHDNKVKCKGLNIWLIIDDYQ